MDLTDVDLITRVAVCIQGIRKQDPTVTPHRFLGAVVTVLVAADVSLLSIAKALEDLAREVRS